MDTSYGPIGKLSIICDNIQKNRRWKRYYQAKNISEKEDQICCLRIVKTNMFSVGNQKTERNRLLLAVLHGRMDLKKGLDSSGLKLTPP